ncbi:unnamed protein product [Dovyalis caffra]|uniref:Uncharacterized protein n=1 Tax=Dovyalis caffra TaxID=77055 RepID=A0AAV1SE54_9ROSI|nr:unnamed protein product [Dovyalis caffra]
MGTGELQSTVPSYLACYMLKGYLQDHPSIAIPPASEPTRTFRIIDKRNASAIADLVAICKRFPSKSAWLCDHFDAPVTHLMNGTGRLQMAYLNIEQVLTIADINSND